MHRAALLSRKHYNFGKHIIMQSAFFKLEAQNWYINFYTKKAQRLTKDSNIVRFEAQAARIQLHDLVLFVPLFSMRD